MEHLSLVTRDEAATLLDQHWGPRARLSEEAHYVVATRFSMYNRILSYSAALIGLVTGSGLFATLSKQDEKLQLWLGIISVAGAAIVAYQRSQQFAARSTEHQKAGADWGPVVNVTEELREQIKSRDPKDSELDRLRRDMDDVTRRSPQIPQHWFNKFKIGDTYLYGNEHQ